MSPDSRTSRVVTPLFQLWSHVYDARFFQRFYGSIHDRILARAPAEVRAALDVGCGTGELVVKLARRYPGARIVGVDISAAMLRQARQKDHGAAAVELLEGSVYTLPFPDASFDLVTNTISSHFYRDLHRRRARARARGRAGGDAGDGEPRQRPAPSPAREHGQGDQGGRHGVPRAGPPARDARGGRLDRRACRRAPPGRGALHGAARDAVAPAGLYWPGG